MGQAAAAWLRTVWDKRREAVVQLAHFAAGFLMSASPVLASAPPFGLAFAGAALPSRALAAGTGAMAGYLLRAQPAVALRWIASVVLLTGLRWAFAFLGERRLALYTPLLASLACGVTGAALVFSGEGDASASTAVCDCAITAAAGILFSRGLRALDDREPLAGTAAIGVGTLLCVLLTGAAAVVAGAFSPVYLAVLWAVLCAAVCGRGALGVLIGAGAGISASLAGDPTLLSVFTAGSLAAAAFAPLGRVFAALSMAGCGTAAFLFCGQSERVAPYLIVCAAALGLLAATPLSVPRALGFLGAGDPAAGEPLRRLMAERLYRVRTALDAIASTSRAVSDRLETLGGEPAQRLIDGACEGVCGGCSRKAQCWTGYGDRMAACGDIFFGNAAAFPSHLPCAREELLIARLRQAGAHWNARRDLQIEARQLKSVTADQFVGMSLLLGDLSDELASLTCAQESETENVRRVLSSLGAEPLAVSCFLDPRGLPLLLAQVPAHCAARLAPARAAAALSEAVGCPLAPAASSPRGTTVSFCWRAAPLFSAELCRRQSCADGSRLCGDCGAAFQSGADTAVLLLCDGMGTGKSAAIDAAMSVSLFTELLEAGIHFDAALRIVGAALLSRGQERLCTVDAALLDLYTGRLDSCKAGAAPSYLLRKGKVRRIVSDGLPIGILGGVEAAHTTLALEAGDVLLLVSDGLTDAGDDWIAPRLAALGGGDLEALCAGILETAPATDSRRADDRTVLAARLTRAAPAGGA